MKRHGTKKKHTLRSVSRRYNRKDLIAAIGLEPEGKTRGSKYDFSTAEYVKEILTGTAPRYVKARKKLKLT